MSVGGLEEGVRGTRNSFFSFRVRAWTPLISVMGRGACLGREEVFRNETKRTSENPKKKKKKKKIESLLIPSKSPEE